MCRTVSHTGVGARIHVRRVCIRGAYLLGPLGFVRQIVGTNEKSPTTDREQIPNLIWKRRARARASHDNTLLIARLIDTERGDIRGADTEYFRDGNGRSRADRYNLRRPFAINKRRSRRSRRSPRSSSRAERQLIVVVFFLTTRYLFVRGLSLKKNSYKSHSRNIECV